MNTNAAGFDRNRLPAAKGAALMLRDGKDYLSAETMLRKATELAPDDVNIRRQLGAVITLNLIHNSQEASTTHETYWTQDVR